MALIKRVVKGVKFDIIGIFGSFPYTLDMSGYMENSKTPKILVCGSPVIRCGITDLILKNQTEFLIMCLPVFTNTETGYPGKSLLVQHQFRFVKSLDFKFQYNGWIQKGFPENVVTSRS
jgi:hypothetical protein